MEHALSIRKLMEKEMRNKLFFHVPPERMRYLPHAKEPYILGKWVSYTFPSSNFDAEEAAASLSCGRATAAVFHLMRVLEIGLTALGKVFGVSLEHTNWATAWLETNGCILPGAGTPKANSGVTILSGQYNAFSIFEGREKKCRTISLDSVSALLSGTKD
jgi:hypothetical protein